MSRTKYRNFYTLHKYWHDAQIIALYLSSLAFMIGIVVITLTEGQLHG